MCGYTRRCGRCRLRRRRNWEAGWVVCTPNPAPAGLTKWRQCLGWPQSRPRRSIRRRNRFGRLSAEGTAHRRSSGTHPNFNGTRDTSAERKVPPSRAPRSRGTRTGPRGFGRDAAPRSSQHTPVPLTRQQRQTAYQTEDAGKSSHQKEYAKDVPDGALPKRDSRVQPIQQEQRGTPTPQSPQRRMHGLRLRPPQHADRPHNSPPVEESQIEQAQ